MSSVQCFSGEDLDIEAAGPTRQEAIHNPQQTLTDSSRWGPFIRLRGIPICLKGLRRDHARLGPPKAATGRNPSFPSPTRGPFVLCKSNEEFVYTKGAANRSCWQSRSGRKQEAIDADPAFYAAD